MSELTPFPLPPFPAFEFGTLKDVMFKPSAAIHAVEELKENALKVTAVLTHNDLNEASMVLKDIGRVKKELEEHRKALKEPFKVQGEKIDQYFKMLVVEINKEDERLLKGVNGFNEKQKAIARAKADQERARLQEQLDKENKEAEEKGEPVSEAVLPEVEVKVAKLSDQNVAGIKEVRYKRWRVTDITKVPVKYLVVDEKAMNEARKQYDMDAKSPIPGIEFYVESNVKR